MSSRRSGARPRPGRRRRSGPSYRMWSRKAASRAATWGASSGVARQTLTAELARSSYSARAERRPRSRLVSANDSSGAWKASCGSPKPDTIVGMPRSENAASTGSEPPVRISTGSRPHARASAARAIRSGLLVGVEPRRAGEHRRVRQLGAVRQRARAAAPRARAEIVAGSWPGASRTDRSQVATGGMIVRASPPRMRCTSSDGVGAGADVELGARPPRRQAVRRPRRARRRRRAARPSSPAPRRSAARSPARSGSGRRPSGPGSTAASARVERVEGVQRGAAVDARMRDPLAGADLELGEHDPARGGRDRGRLGVEHPGVEDDRAVGAALVGEHPLVDVVGAGLLGALDEHAHVHGQLARVGHLARDVQQREEVALVVGRRRARTGGRRGCRARTAASSSRTRRPGPARRSGRRSARSARPRAPRAARRPPAARRRACRPARTSPPAASTRRCAHSAAARSAVVVALAGRDRRDPQPVGGLVDERVELGAHLITASVSPLATAAPFGDRQLGHRAGLVGGDLVLHLHRLDDADQRALLDLGALLDQHLEDVALERRGERVAAAAAAAARLALALGRLAGGRRGAVRAPPPRRAP